MIIVNSNKSRKTREKNDEQVYKYYLVNKCLKQCIECNLGESALNKVPTSEWMKPGFFFYNVELNLWVQAHNLLVKGIQKMAEGSGVLPA